MTDMTIANEIARQIGNKALYMLGAQNLVAGNNYLAFRIRGSKKINYIRITLNAMDTYDMELGKIWGANHKVVATHNGIYNDMLHSIIESETGLYTSLGTMGR